MPHGTGRQRWSLFADRALRLLPSVIGTLTLILLIAPLLVMVPIAFSDVSFLKFPPPSYSLRWVSEFFSDVDWRGSIVHSSIIAAATGCVAVTMGTACAFGLVRGRPRVGQLCQPLLIAPLVVPTIVTGIAMFTVLGRFELIDTFPGLILAYLVITLPIVILTVAPGVSSIDRNLEAAASTLGARPGRVFWLVTFPQIRGPALAAWLFAAVTAFDEIVLALFLSGERTRTLPLLMWAQINQVLTPIIATAAVLLIAAAAVFVSTASVLMRWIR